VEDTMLVKLAELASARGCRELHLNFNPTSKNGPAAEFLNRVCGQNRLPRNGGFVYVAPIDWIHDHPQLVKTNYGYRFGQIESPGATKPTRPASAFPSGLKSPSEAMQRIASLDDAQKIVTAIRAQSRVRQTKRSGPPVPPRTPTEERMAQIWKEVLNLDQIGVHDNFFDLGGHSLLATQLLSRVHDVFEVRPPLRTIFETPTIAGFAETIAQDRLAQLDAEDLAQMLAQLSQVSDEEAARMIQ
jgi:acyl carrier protein